MPNNTYMPVCISLENRPCLIVGGGEVAVRKIDTLMEYSSDITVVAPEPNEKIEYYAQRNFIKLEKRAYQSPEAQNYGLVISASNDKEVNETVSRDCREKSIPVNVVDSPKQCDFIFPATLTRDCLSISLSTDGKAPFLAGHLRLVLENIFPAHWEKIARLAATFRKKVHKKYPDDISKKAECFEHFLNTDWQTMIKEVKNEKKIEEELDKLLG